MTLAIASPSIDPIFITMIKRLVIGLLFILFAAVQYNDPDPGIWILAYSIIGIIAIVDIWRPISKPVLLLILAIYTIGAACYIPHIWDWVHAGTPSIVGEMKATTSYIEWMREFLGLVLCAGATFWLYRSSSLLESKR